MRKKLLSLALALVLCLGLTAPASAAGATLTEVYSRDTYIGFWGNFPSRVSVPHFYEGLAWVGNAVLIDTNGNVIAEAGTYSHTTNFYEGVAWATRGDVRCVLDKTGRELFTIPKNTYMSFGDFHEGIAKVQSTETKKYGFIDLTGNLVIPCEYENVEECHDGLIRVYDKPNAYYGYMDKTGKMVIPFQYAGATDFEDGAAIVNTGTRKTLIDKTGKEVLPEGYIYDGKFSSEMFLVASLDANGYYDDYWLMNKAWQIVGKAPGRSFNFLEGLAASSEGYINESGQVAIPLQCKSAEDFLDGFAVIENNDDTRSIINKAGQVTATCQQVSDLRGGAANRFYPTNIGNGCFKTYSTESGRKRYGLIDYTGKEIVPCKYKEIKDFHDGVAPVQDFADKWGFVDTTGKEIVPCQYDWGDGYCGSGLFVLSDWSIVKASGWTAPAASGTPSTPAAPSGLTVNPNSSTVLVNGKNVAFDAYTIEGSNYFKLRDLAYVLNGTEKQFEVGWDNASKTITLTSGQGYTANGSEMAKGSGAQSASVSSSKLLIDGKEVSLTAYSINGNNYFKLRDIGEAFDFGIGWDNASKTITIDTTTGYTA